MVGFYLFVPIFVKPFFQLMNKFFITITLFSLTLSSCIVSKKKYDDLLAQKVRLDADVADRDSLLAKANADLRDLDDRAKKLSADTTTLGQEVRTKSSKLADMDKEYAQLNNYYKNLLTCSGKLNRDMAQQQEQFLAIQQNLERTRKTDRKSVV